MAALSPSKILAARIDSKRRERPSLTVEAAYDLIKKEDPKLIKQFGVEVGFDPSTTTSPLMVSAE
jgi:hypothetical protein